MRSFIEVIVPAFGRTLALLSRGDLLFMVNLHSNLQASILFTPMDSSSSGTSSSSSSSSQTLANEISQAFSQTLQQLGIDPNSIKLTIDTGSGQTSDTSQNSAATSSVASQLGFTALVPANIVTTPATTAAATTAATTAAATTTSTTTAAAASSSSGSSSTGTHWYADNAADDAYWSAQPAAVQQLREIRNPEQRQALAETLSSEGYTIDNAIMVWGWDAGATIAERQADGYTWVPAANQAAISAAPGLTGPGITPYDPNNPPAGSIPVPAAAT